MCLRFVQRRYALVLLASVAGGLPGGAHGQATCSEALAAQALLPSDTSRALFELLFPLDQQLDQITWNGAQARARPQTKVVVHDDVSNVGSTLRDAIAHDTTAKRQVAEVLARIMRGEPSGSSAGQAVLASDLYEAWNLPFEPAATVLVDPKESMAARALTVFALRPYWAEERYQVVARSAACSLAARAAGAQGMLRGRAPAEAERVLNADEMELLEWLTRSLDGHMNRDRWRNLGFETALGRDNPVTVELRRSLGLSDEK